MDKLGKAITEIGVLSPPRVYIRRVLKAICDNLDYRYGTVIEVDDHGEGRMVASHNLPEDYPERVHQAKAPILSSPSGKAIETGRIVVVHDSLSDPRIAPWYEIFRSFNIKTVVWVPLLSEGRAFGTYVLYDTRIRDVSEEELHALEQIGVMISIAIASNRCLNQLNRKTEELEREIAERKRAEEALLEIEEFNSSILNNSPNPMLVIDPDTSVRYANPALEKVTGFASAEIIGRKAPYPWWPEETVHQTSGELLKAMQEGLQRFEKLLQKKNGEHFWVEITSATVRKEEEFNYYLSNWVDITERKRAEDEKEILIRRLEATNQKLAESNKELQDFVYVASHDLREPLRKISTFGRLLQETLAGRLDEDQQENFEFMIDGANRMQEMVDAILSYSRVITKAKPSEVVDLNRIIDDLEGLELSDRLEETAGTITVPEPLPPVYADPSQVRQLFQNMIVNGLKYHRQGKPPEVTIRASETDDMVRAEVSDNGIGIAGDYYDDVFTMFRRLNPRKDYEGTGIGLTVCKRIVKRHGGEIWISSTPGEGSTFYFTLPKG